MKVVVIGGSGLIGRNVVRRLAGLGHDPVPASSSTGVDIITGEGLTEVVVGALTRTRGTTAQSCTAAS
jgi:uncharacterized protein YbjT (DUF2867 family)